LFNQNLVSIGIPVFNGERTISRCLDSVLGQTYSNLEIIISDNNSTDHTFEICKSFAERDSRIVLIRQESNIGPAGNFASVFQRSSGKYFCWIASDDYRSLDFIQLNHDFLENNSSAVASTSPHEFLVEHSTSVLGKNISLCGEIDSRVTNFLIDPWNSHALFYALYRRESLEDYSKLGHNFLGWDWAIIFHSLLLGNIQRIDKGLISLQSGGQSDRTDALRMSGVSGLKFAFPLFDFMHFALKAGLKRRPFLSIKMIMPLSYLGYEVLKYEYLLFKHFLKNKL
jgi:glycosyltransferase involved in cell wall biosynthesis